VSPAPLTIFVDNPGGGSVEIVVDGELADPSATCAGGGAASYPKTTLTCVGSGVVRCGQIERPLQPGAWVHRLDEVRVDGMLAAQQQAQRRVLVAGDPVDVSNAVVWTIYPAAFVVQQATADEVQLRLDQATAYTACNPDPDRRALVTFSWDVFSASAQKEIELLPADQCGGTGRNVCTPTRVPTNCPCDPASVSIPCVWTGAPDGTHAGLCIAGDRITIDALDRDAQPGGVMLSVASCAQKLLRLYGTDDVLRGLTLEGSQVPVADPTTCGDPGGPIQVDTVAITGPRASGDLVEQSRIVGPTCGDAVSVDDDATGNTIATSEILNAADRGVKVDMGGSATIDRSCVHDNRKGGIQATLGGTVMASENVVQRNMGGKGQNGLTVVDQCPDDQDGCPDDRRSMLTTWGNVVRFAGGRGVSVRDNATGMFWNDYVANNTFKGSVVETTKHAPVDGQGMERVPTATFSGVGITCNFQNALTKQCNDDEETPCTTDTDCCLNDDGTIDPTCTKHCTGSIPPGVGAETHADPGHASPVVTYGDAGYPTDGQPGRNAFTSNRNPTRNDGANFLLTNVTAPVTAIGDQWAHCTGVTCDVATILSMDVSPAGADVAVAPEGWSQFHGPKEYLPFIAGVTPARPRKGDIVRVYGENFDAINGNPARTDADPCNECSSVALAQCSQAADGTPRCPTGPCIDGTCPCAIDNPAVELRNAGSKGPNRIYIVSQWDGSAVADLAPDAVTPTMLAFRMPFDCYAPLVVHVAKYGATEPQFAFPLCDAKGCKGERTTTPCDDGNPLTLNDHCDGDGRCVSDTILTTTTDAASSTTSTTALGPSSTSSTTTSTTGAPAFTTTSTTATLSPSTTSTTLLRVCGLIVPSEAQLGACEKPKLLRRSARLLRSIERALAKGRRPKCLRVRLLTNVLRRCEDTQARPSH
jgi:hypothetical protein